MKRRRSKLRLVFLSVVLLALGGWAIHALFLSAADEEEDLLLFDRFWMTEIPEQETDYVHEFLVTQTSPHGFFAKASMYRFEEEIFEYERGRDGQFRLRFPQTERTATIGLRVTRCDSKPPFDLCLELDENPWGGPLRYYSFSDEEEEGQHRRDSRQRLERLERLRGR